MNALSGQCPLCGAASSALWNGARTPFHCSGCHVVWIRRSHQVSPDDSWSRQYFESYYRPRARALCRDFGSHLDWLKQHVAGTRWLDVGCGGGYFARAALDRGWQVTGVDPSPHAVALARETAPEGRFLCGDAGALDPQERFDVISFWDSMSVIPSLGEAIDAYLRHLASGGAVVIKNPNVPVRMHRATGALLGWRPRLRDEIAGLGISCWHFTPASMAAFLRSHGVEVIQQRWVREVPGEREPEALRLLPRKALRSALHSVAGPRRSFMMVGRKQDGVTASAP